MTPKVIKLQDKLDVLSQPIMNDCLLYINNQFYITSYSFDFENEPDKFNTVFSKFTDNEIEIKHAVNIKPIVLSIRCGDEYINYINFTVENLNNKLVEKIEDLDAVTFMLNDTYSDCIELNKGFKDIMLPLYSDVLFQGINAAYNFKQKFSMELMFNLDMFYSNSKRNVKDNLLKKMFNYICG